MRCAILGTDKSFDTMTAKPSAVESDAAKMRQRASRLLDLATRSRCEGRPDYASVVTDLATEILEHARNIENESGNISPSVGNRNRTSRPDAA
jgi:hypothetical protein